MKQNQEFEVNLFHKLCAKTGYRDDGIVRETFKSAAINGELIFYGYTFNTTLSQIISDILRKSTNILTVSFTDCMLNHNDLAIIIKSIAKNNYIKELNLLGNNIKTTSVSNIGLLLNTNTSIKSLNLKWNNFGISLESFAIFCNGLAKNVAIESLDLRNNNLSTLCVSHLANALKSNSKLKHLDLRWNKIKTSGAENLLSVLEQNKSLRSIKLKGNMIRSELILAIETSLKSNSVICELNLKSDEMIKDLLNKIKNIEEIHATNINSIKDAAEKQISESSELLAELTNKLSDKQKLIYDLEKQLQLINSNLNNEQQKSINLEELLKERDQLYNELSSKSYSSIETLKKALHEKDLEEKRLNTLLSIKVNKEQEYCDNLEAELNTEKFKNNALMEENVSLKNKMEILIKQKTECLEIERDLWQKKYDELEKSSIAQLQRIKSMALDKQQSLENTIMELSDKQSSHIITMSERYERLKQEKSMVEDQLTAVQNTVVTLQRENSSLLLQISEPNRKVNTLLEELTNERLKMDKIRQKKVADERIIAELRNEIEKLQTDFDGSRNRESEMVGKFENEVRRLKYFNKLLQKKLENKHQKIIAIRNQERERIRVLNSAMKKYLEKPSLASKSSSES